MSTRRIVPALTFVVSLTLGLSSCQSENQSARDPALLNLAGHAEDTAKKQAPPPPPPPQEPDPNKGGAGVGPPTVHGCDAKGCGNNGPFNPTPPPKKCTKMNGIEVCT